MTIAELSSGPLAQLERAHIMLAEASTLDEVKGLRDQAQALAAYSKAAELGLTMQNECAELKLRAERKAGEMLRAMPKHGGGRPSENRLHDVTSSLADVGVTKIQSHRWQQVAAVPEPEFERHLAEAKESKAELTTSGVLAKGKQLKAESELQKAIEHYPFLADVPDTPESQIIATATALDAYEGVEFEQRMESARKWVEMKRREADNPRQPSQADVANKAVGLALNQLVEWNVSATRALNLWEHMTIDPAIEGEWQAAINLATGFLASINTNVKQSNTIRRIK